MAIRLADILVYGEMRNLKPWCTHGRLLLRGADCTVSVELTGNCDPDLQGKAIRFAPRSAGSMQQLFDSLERANAERERQRATAEPPARSSDADGDPSAHGSSGTAEADEEEGFHAYPAGLFDGPKAPPGLPDDFGFHQIGTTGDATAARWVRALPCSLNEYRRRCRLGEKPPTQWKRSLYFEWFGQNGRVLIELVDPIIEYEMAEDHWLPLPPPSEPMPERDPDAPPPASRGDETLAMPQAAGAQDGDSRSIPPEELHAEPLLPVVCTGDESADFQRQLDAQNRALERELRGGGESEEDLIAELELMDDLIDHGEGVTPASLFSPRTLPRPDDVTEEQAGRLLKTLLMELALHGVAFHACDHSTARQLYRLFVEEVMHDGEVYRELRGTGWVQNLCAYEYCPQCKAAEEEKYREAPGGDPAQDCPF